MNTMALKYPTTPKLGAIGLCMLLMFGMVTTMGSTAPAGCSVSQVENEINTLAQQITGLIAVAEPGQAWVADLQKELPVLSSAEATWKSGGGVQDVINVLNEIELIVAVVPLTAAYSPLVDLIVTCTDLVLARFLPTATPTAAPVTASAKMGAASPNLHKGKVVVKSLSDGKKQWNDYVRTHPALAPALLK